MAARVSKVELGTESVQVALVRSRNKVKALHARKADAQIAPNVHGVRVEVERLEVAAGRLGVVAEVGVRDTQVEPAAGVAGLELKGAVVCRQRLLGALAVGEGGAKFVPERVVVGASVERLAKGGDSAPKVARHVEEHAENLLHLRVVGSPLGGLEHELHDVVHERPVTVHVLGDLETLKAGVVDHPRLEVLERPFLVQLIDVRDAESQESVKVVGIVLYGTLQAGDGLGVLVVFLVRHTEHAPGVCVRGVLADRSLKRENGLGELAGLKKLESALVRVVLGRERVVGGGLVRLVREVGGLRFAPGVVEGPALGVGPCLAEVISGESGFLERVAVDGFKINLLPCHRVFPGFGHCRLHLAHGTLFPRGLHGRSSVLGRFGPGAFKAFASLVPCCVK
mmetsp:Transcript_21734/g.61897  ORF Transcript_21734/g.61897 Transcript_21734/m.61897 type:complete len:396 (+) Transcript_21734:121-1308(+)